MDNLSSGHWPDKFTYIIDADHLSINRIAGKVRRLLASASVSSRLPELRRLLLEVTWRLIRHDFSEDMVMRPAFVSVLGERGVRMVEEDRVDHVNGWNALLQVLNVVEELQSGEVEDNSGDKLKEASSIILTTFDQLAEHMKIESGEYLPYFESIVPASMSQRLAQEYADTLIVTPNLRWPLPCDGCVTEQVVFEAGADEYAHVGQDRLKEIYARLLEVRSNSKDRIWFQEAVQRELKQMEIDKKQKTNITPANQEKNGPKESKVPTNPLGLPISWHAHTKGKL